jgi:hypothetical protein
MSKRMCLMSAGCFLLALGGWVLVSAQGNAAQPGKELKEGVLKIADTIKKGDMAGADAQAVALAKKVEDLGDLMDFFKKRDKGGIGVGSKAGVVVPDGIEMKLVGLGRESPSVAALKKEAASLEEMGYVVAAMAKVARAKPATGAKAKEWNGWCDAVAADAVKLSAAAKSQGAADLKTIARKINESCNACHSAYRK